MSHLNIQDMVNKTPVSTGTCRGNLTTTYLSVPWKTVPHNLLNYRPMSSWWSQVSWCQTGTMPSAATMKSQLRLSYLYELSYFSTCISRHGHQAKFAPECLIHYCDVIMNAIASQITSVSIVYSSVCSDADQRWHQSSASLAFVRGIHRGPVNSLHKRPVTRKMFLFDDVIMIDGSPLSDNVLCVFKIPQKKTRIETLLVLLAVCEGNHWPSGIPLTKGQ